MFQELKTNVISAATIVQVVVVYVVVIMFFKIYCLLGGGGVKCKKYSCIPLFKKKEVLKCFELPRAVYKFPVVIVMIIITVTKQH